LKSGDDIDLLTDRSSNLYGTDAAGGEGFLDLFRKVVCERVCELDKDNYYYKNIR
jgi:hypothetical protein